jgi:flagellar basal-body rod modification protein FlgD
MTTISTSILQTTAPVNTLATATSKAGSQLTEKDFLSLLTAQLKNQDPTSPVDNAQMAAQLAQFSTVSGITDMNTTLNGISQQLTAQTAVLHNIAESIAAKTPATPA